MQPLTSFFKKAPAPSRSSLRPSMISSVGNPQRISDITGSSRDLKKTRALGEVGLDTQPTEEKTKPGGLEAGTEKEAAQSTLVEKLAAMCSADDAAGKRMPPAAAGGDDDSEDALPQKRSRRNVRKVSPDDYKPGNDSASEDSSIDISVGDLEDLDSSFEKQQKKKITQSAKPNKKPGLKPIDMKSKKATTLDVGIRKSAPPPKRNEGKAGEIVDQEDHVIGGGFSKESDIHDALPEFLKQDKLMDAQKRRPSDPNYDPTTLYIPQRDFDQATPCMRQYWELKRTNFEKIFFFKLGKFYEIFFLDSIIC